MKEIEIKAKIKDKEALVQKLKEKGCVFGEPITHVDTVYTKITGTLPEFLSNDHFLRIRKKGNGKSVFTVKKPVSREVLTKIEYETEVEDSEALEQALFVMGYKAANVVKKERKIGHCGEYEICLDEVYELGSFIEVERMSDGDHDLIRREIFDFLGSLGVTAEDEVRKGYDILMIEKMLSK